MKNGSTIKPMLSKSNWWLSVLLCAFIFATNTTSFNVQQRIPVTTEQLETVRSIGISIASFEKLSHLTHQPNIFEIRFLLSILSCSNHIQIKIRNQSQEILRFKPNTICWALNVSPRLSLDIPLA